MMHLRHDEDHVAPPLSEREAEHRLHGICFKTGPPGTLGVELEWLVCDRSDPALSVPHQRVARSLAVLDAPGSLPGAGRLTFEPGGQVELSSAPAASLGDCVAGASRDLAALRQALRPAGLTLLLGTDLVKDPAVLLAAYDDHAGVTAAFNKNILSVLNTELGAGFDTDAFEHVAIWDPAAEWIEMRLRSRSAGGHAARHRAAGHLRCG